MTKPYVWTNLDADQLIVISTGNTENGTVKAPLPETIPFPIANEVNETFDFFKIRSKLIQTLSSGKEINIDRGIAERQFWRAIVNQEFTFELNFESYYSGQIDVVVPIKKLLLMGSPIEKNYTNDQLKTTRKVIEEATGADTKSLTNYWSAPARPYIKVGSLYKLKNVLIKSINVSYSNKLDIAGDPISAVVSLTIIPRNPQGYSTINNNMKYRF